ncbi:MAG TPA: hypothetical protein VMH88_12075 [Gemmatimonadales bacterium]|nr:hypothetical protein [Gemmatimonadales bacterium]
MSRRSRILVVSLLAAAAACSDAVAPVAGTLTVSLTTPYGNVDEAVLLVLRSPTPPASEQATGTLVLWRDAPPGTMDTLVLTGILGTGPLLTLGVTDVNQVSHYQAQLVQVAAERSHVLRELTGYSVAVSK